MSIANTDGDGYGDTTGLVYGFDDEETESKEIRKVIRSGYGHIGVSPGDVEPMSATRSTLDDRLPERPLPGDPGLIRDDCGDDMPGFACEECGCPRYIGRTCYNPACERCWAAAVKAKTIRSASKLDALRRDLYVNDYNERENVDFQHVVASLPELLVDSDEPVKHAYKILKVLLEKKWGIKGFLAIYHPYRIKDEYRKDQYDHGGAEGQGDMTWADVLSSENPEEYIKFEPHFHLLFPSRRYAFDYSVVEEVERQSGWVFNRFEKNGDDDHRSVANLDDLVHQICYCFSHAGVHERESRNELTSVMKGRLHNISVLDDGTEEQVTASFCDAAPKLLGVRFSNVNESNCEAEQCDCDGECECEDDHPLHELYNQWDDGTNGLDNSVASSSAAPSFDEGSPTIDDTSASHSLDGNTQSSDQESSSGNPTSSPRSVPNPAVTDRNACGGDLIPIREASDLLDDDEWCKQARYSEALQLAFNEWEDRVDDDEWEDGMDDDGEDDDDDDEKNLGEFAVQRR